MRTTLHQATLFALYQMTVVLGIAMFPIALLVNRLGLSLPLGRALETLGEAYENAAR